MMGQSRRMCTVNPHPRTVPFLHSSCPPPPLMVAANEIYRSRQRTAALAGLDSESFGRLLLPLLLQLPQPKRRKNLLLLAGDLCRTALLWPRFSWPSCSSICQVNKQIGKGGRRSLGAAGSSDGAWGGERDSNITAAIYCLLGDV